MDYVLVFEVIRKEDIIHVCVLFWEEGGIRRVACVFSKGVRLGV